jgi:hypothetical protein
MWNRLVLIAALLVVPALPASAFLLWGNPGGRPTGRAVGPSTAPNGIIAYWGMEAASAALRGPTHYVIQVCEPAGTPCFSVGTDATTGQITPAIVSAATGVNTPCNNTTNVCILGGGAGNGIEFYDQSGNGLDALVQVAHDDPIFVVPVSVGGGTGCPSTFSASMYCAYSPTNNIGARPTGPPTATCPCSIMAFAIDTVGTVGSGSFGPVAVQTDSGNFTIESDGGEIDFYGGLAAHRLADTSANHWYNAIGSSDSGGGFVATNNSAGASVSESQSPISGHMDLMGVGAAGAGGWIGYWFKGAFWQNNGGALPVTSANAATMIANTCTRATGSSTC